MDTDVIATPTGAAEDEAYRQARKRAESLQGLYVHVLVFAVVNLGLFAINLLTRGDGGAWWFQWPLLVWGIALALHMLAELTPVFSPEWVDRKARRMASLHDS